tara:strand:+ start:2178 stop:2711 length:534 start_codon:yes stop_codon:yes gene_type:complete
MKIAFLDRDGVINKDIGYAYKIKDLMFCEKSIEGMKLLIKKNYNLIIITNQSGIGRGLYREKDFFNFMNHMYLELEKENIKILDTFFCPHHPTKGIGEYKKNCNCRKPKAGMIIEAKKKWSINLDESILVGDKYDDIEAGRSAGLKKLYLINNSSSGNFNNFKSTKENLFEVAQEVN